MFLLTKESLSITLVMVSFLEGLLLGILNITCSEIKTVIPARRQLLVYSFFVSGPVDLKSCCI